MYRQLLATPLPHRTTNYDVMKYLVAVFLICLVLAQGELTLNLRHLVHLSRRLIFLVQKTIQESNK